MAEQKAVVNVRIWGSWGFNGKSEKVRAALKEFHNLEDDQINITKGAFRELYVAVGDEVVI